MRFMQSRKVAKRVKTKKRFDLKALLGVFAS